MVRVASPVSVPVLARAVVSLDEDAISLTAADGQTRCYQLDGCAVLAVDATCLRRFVRMLILERAEAGCEAFAAAERLIIITPPDQGSIAPAVARVAPAPSDAFVVDSDVWEALWSWFSSGGRLAACSLPELVRLATIASPRFAVIIGEVAADIALEAAAARVGPLRGGHTVEDSLRPLCEAARHSPSAEDAWVAAWSRASAPRARRATGT